MTAKPKLALYWAASCGGCEIAVLAIDEKILEVAAAFDIVLWPVAIDAKVRDVEKMADKSIDVCLFNGSIRNSEQEYMAQLLRRKSKILVAFGSCAHEGCIPGLANLSGREAIFDYVYRKSPSVDNPQGILPQPEFEAPEGTLHIPVFYDTVKTLDQTVDGGLLRPGLPAGGGEHLRHRRGGHRRAGWRALPPAGTVLGKETTVCDECARTRAEKKITASSAPGRSSPTRPNACSNRAWCAWDWRRVPDAGRCARRSTRPASAATAPTSMSRTSAPG